MPKKAKKAKPAKKAKKVAKSKKPTKPKSSKKPKKAKAKPVKKAAKKAAAKKPAKKTVAKPASKAKTAAKPAPKTQKPAAPAAVPQGPIKPAGAIGRVVHYYDRIQVAIVLLSGKLSVGDKITFKRGDREFVQKIKSIQVQHKPLQHASSGQVVGLKVDQIAPEGSWLIK